MTLTALAIAELTGGRVLGDGGREVDGIATLAAAGPRDLTFLKSPKGLAAARASRAGVIIAGAIAEGASIPATLVICDNPRLAFARAGRRVCPPHRAEPGVHPTSVVDPSARLGALVSIGAHAVVDEGVVLGDRVAVGPGAHVGRGVSIGDDTILKSNVVIYPGATIGARVIVHAGSVLGSDGFGYVRDQATGRYEAFPQVGRLVVEDEVEIGALCAIDRGALGETRIRRGTKIDNLVHVAHNVQIGEDVVMAGQSGVAGSAVIGDRVVIAGQAGIADHARVEDDVLLGGQCLVPTGKTLKGPGVLFWGAPARPLRQRLKELAVLARLAKK